MNSFTPASLLWDEPHSIVERIMGNVEKVMVGKRQPIEALVIAMLGGGHVLLEDVPGVGKTMLVKALAATVDCGFKRIQCTPDLMPSDVTGVSVFNRRDQDFEFRPGPLFAHIVLADELNRASPKTQAALLEAMEEGSVTADGTTYRLPEPFMLLATQNPADHEGTFPLPEAQTDRFLLRIRLGYPEPRQEVAMLGRLQEKSPLDRLKPMLLREELARLQRFARAVHTDEPVKEYIVAIVSATRTHRELVLGASPRASLALMRAAQAKALVSGRTYVIPDDVKALVPGVLAHRLTLSGEARMAGKTAEQILADIAGRTTVPGLRFAAGS